MNFKYLLIVLTLFLTNFLTAQKAVNILKADKGEQQAQFRACNSDAGTIDLGNFVGQSNRNQLNDTIFLCWLDRFYIDHNNDSDLSGDPDPSTTPGIGYAWYNGTPTITGLDLPTIETDPQAYKPAGELVVYVDKMNGDAVFENGYYSGLTTFNDYISGGNITQKYFAPITFDSRIGSQALYEGVPAGECVNARVDQAFTVVYLNEIKANNIQTHFMGDPTRAQFNITGGMPEFDGSDFTDIIVQLKNKPSVKAILDESSYTHGDNVAFTVSEYGLYQIILRDGVSCEVIEEINVQENQVPLFVLDTLSGQPGDIVCLTWSVRDFEGIQFIFGGIKFNPSVVAYSGFNALNFHNVDVGAVIGPDQISVQWVPLNPEMTNLSDGEEIVEICFEIVGEPGDCTPIYFNNTDAVFTDALGGGDCSPNQEHGMICVDPPNGLYAEIDICGSRSGADEGTVSFQVFGGTGPYSFVLQSSTGTIISTGNISAGAGKITLFDIPAAFNYDLIITDALGVSITEDVDIITIDDPLSVTFNSIKNPTCFGYSDGSLGIDVTGSAVINPGDYTIEWSTADYGVNNLILLGNGNYGVTVTESFTGCEASAYMTLSADPIVVEFNILDTAFCADSGGGRIEAIVSGGTPKPTGYDFEWNSDNKYFPDQGFSSIFEDISPGIIFFETHDKYDYCKIQDTLEMPYLYDLEVLAQVQNPLCKDEKNGNIQLKATLGDYPSTNFTFFPIPPYAPASENFTVIGTDSLYADNLGQGFYRIEITEINTGCKTVADYFFSNPQQIQTNLNVTGVGCGDEQLGTATVLVFGGTEPYQITSSSGLPQVDVNKNEPHTYTDLSEGIYYLSILDGVGCTFLDTFEIIGSDQLLSIDSLVYEPFECIPNPKTDIVVFATSSDGVNTFNDKFYKWIKNGFVIDVDSTLQNVGPGKYYIEVSNSKGCVTIDSIELFEPELFTIDLAMTEPECAGANGGTPGSICVSPNGGAPGFTYSWNNEAPISQDCLDNISEGSYTLQVADGNNCKVDTIIVLTGPSEVDVQIIDVGGISCNDGQTFDGALTVTASGGNNPTNSYSYLLSSGTSGFGQIHVANDLEGGDNWVLVSFNTLSGNVCFADTAYFDIEVPEVLEMDFSKLFVQDVSCYDQCDGIAIVGATGGNNLFYGYEWIQTGNTGAAVSDLCAGTYEIEITDANGCAVIESISINQPDSLYVYIDPDNTNDINCFGANTGQIQVLHEGGNIGGIFSYNWLNSNATGPLATGLAAGYYSVTVEDEKGCSDVVDITLEAQESLNATIAIPEAIECYGGQTCLSIDGVTGGAGPDYRFSINGGPLYSLDSCITVYASDQDYLIEVYDRDGCSFSTTVNVDQPNEVVVTLGDDVEVGLGESAVLNTQIISDNPVQVIEWSPMGATDFCLGPNCNQLEINPSENMTYEVQVIDSNGCVGTDEINVFVNTKRNVFIPNVFSPNGDAYNERFKIFTGSGVSAINYFRIYDRWGNLMYDENNLEPNLSGVGDWDGTYRGKKLAPGVFVYLVEIDFIDSRKIIYRGSITLLR